MIFPTESILGFRRDLLMKVADGDLTVEQASEQAVAVDPRDALSLRVLASAADEAGDKEKAETLARKLIEANPFLHSGYLILTHALPDAERRNAYGALAKGKLRFDLDGHQHGHCDDEECGCEEEHGAEADVTGVEGFAECEAFPSTVDTAAESAETARELAPHRLIDELIQIGIGEAPRGLLDRIVEHGAGTAPLLMGILNTYSEDLLASAEQEGVAIRALGLLGEIGDPAAVGALMRFQQLDDEAFSDMSRWAVTRIGERRPQETLAAVLRVAEAGEPLLIGAVAQQIAALRKAEGQADAMLSLGEHLSDLENEEAEMVVLSMLVAAGLMEGLGGPTGTAIEARWGKILSRSTRQSFHEMRKEIAEAHREDKGEALPSLYQMCEDGFEIVEADDDGDDPHVHEDEKPGRNDPCWCGSGKKYKKCHLDSDSER